MVTPVQQVAPTPAAVASRTLAAGTNLAPAQLRTLVAAGRKLDTQNPAVVRQAAGQFLSELFFAPLLAEARQFPIGRELGTGGQTEAIFGQRLDQYVADSVTGASPGLVNQMIKRLEQQARRPLPGGTETDWPTRTQLAHQAKGVSS